MNELRHAIGDYAYDLRENLDNVLTRPGAPGLSEKQIWIVAVASAVASRNPILIRTIEAEASTHLDANECNAARAAASIMAMNNVYQRFTVLAGSDDYSKLAPRLRSKVIDDPGVPKITFELACMAVSAINGCAKSIASHEKVLRNHLVSLEARHSSVRIASVLYAVAVTLDQGYPTVAVAQAA